MNILAIETSCDETAAAIIQDGQKILSNVVVSQIDIFAKYGGVIPEIAARSHLEVILPVIHQSFQDAGFILSNNPALDDWSKIDAIAVTHTPGLLGSLLIGTLTARTLAILHNKPLFPVHHLKSHIYANWLNSQDQHYKISQETSNFLNSRHPAGRYRGIAPFPREDGRNGHVSRIEKSELPNFPLLALVISGGHTQIIHMPHHNHFEIIGTTRDDAIGECFDKVAKILGLPYPGGPAISKLALTGNRHQYKLPHPQVPELDFSFSGLKTAVLRAVQHELNQPISFPSHQLAPLLSSKQTADFAASFEQTAIDILLEKLEKALLSHPNVRSLVFAGGVSANHLLRTAAKDRFQSPSLSIFFPDPSFSGDNAAMVGAAAFYEIQSGVQPSDPFCINLFPRSSIR